MYLDSLLEHLEYTCLQGEAHLPVTELVNDSRNVVKDSVFVCIAGAVKDGHDFINDVVAKGAAAIVVEKDVELPEGATVIKVSDTRLALAYMSAAYFGHPAKKLTTIGITGTKGKTTTTYMIKSILENTGKKVGLIGTIETIIGDKVIPSNNTTPESYMVQKYFAEMVEAGCECVVMEASSQGLMLHRMAGFTFDYGIFTNLEPDHISEAEHKDFEDYLRCKSKLFRQCKLGLINIDDSHAEEILQGHTCEIETFGFSEKADVRATGIQLVERPGYLGIAYKVEGLMNMDVKMNVPGKFNIYNSLCAIALCRHFGVSEEEITKALNRVNVRGRVELVPVSDHYTLMIDYAHNAMSLESLLSTLREYHPKRLVCMFGCGGNRSRSRRFEMGEVSSRLADLTVVTSDNPRKEEPRDIINDIIEGVKRGPGNYVEIIDRKEAIKYCMDNAIEGDVIVLAGKGHEDYQEINGVKYHMDERELIADILAGR
ncbi:MAG TPA: UDP-N-acetylmuramoyl-L-alanyl-D-glutamate--2,6-diaminopimelate ligase [Mobilitalea sp.]|nr:UDP-N-acetylmuramoyl-L-alanyl-D-glutamate--2,6-diaminopimelate ligase [Mobilitalea sp.]